MNVQLVDLHQKIGVELKKLRLAAGFTSYEVFAEKNNLSKIQYFKMEKGTNFTLKSLDRILSIHDITIINFFHRFEKDPKPSNDTKCIDRINLILETLNISKLKFSRSLGFSNSNQINAVLNGRNNISAKFAYLIHKKYPQFNFLWILKGEKS